MAYFSYYASWPKLPVHKIYKDKDKEEFTEDVLKILFVADSQIQGYLNEGNTGPFTRWDIDRYLSKTFSWAMYAYDPQVVIFLGDLIDEGSEADQDDYQDYVKRFRNIYTLKSEARTTTAYNGKTQAIFVPGDNDIGGEDTDRVTKEKIERFDIHFPSQQVYTFREKALFEIIPVNALTQTGHKDKDVGNAQFPTQIQYDKEDKDKPLFKMIVSHLPVLINQTHFVQQVLDVLKPSVIFSAHEHRGQNIIARQVKTGLYDANFTVFSQKTLKFFDKNPTNQPGRSEFYSIFLNSRKGDMENQNKKSIPNSNKEKDEVSEIISPEMLHEIVVPTCSYRMGVEEMAFGIGVINLNSVEGNINDKIELFYANLWLPSRFALLFLYLAAIMLSATIFFICRVRRIRRGRIEYQGSWRSKRRSSSNTPSPYRRSPSSNSYYSKLV
jgi:hypothetical protein